MSIEAFLLKDQLSWVSHIMNMPDSRIPKKVYHGQLAVGKCLQCGPVLRYKDALKVNMKQCNMGPSTLSSYMQDHSAWRAPCHEAVGRFKDSPVEVLEHRRAVQKGTQPRSNLST